MASFSIYVATQNENKLKEMETYIQAESLDVKLHTLKDLPAVIAEKFDPVEDADTFLENAFKKARALYDLIQKPVLAEDAGLEVDALSGRPGVHSSRYGKDDNERISRLLRELAPFSQEERSARFVSTLCFLDENGNDIYFHGRAEGTILTERRGEGGFGYDPVFYSPEVSKTFAQITREEKQNVSHRGRALKNFFHYLASVKPSF